jgi:hypothetical protein
MASTDASRLAKISLSLQIDVTPRAVGGSLFKSYNYFYRL